MVALVELATGVAAVLATLLAVVVVRKWKMIFRFTRLIKLMLTQALHLLRHRGKYWSFADLFEGVVDRNPSATMIIMADTDEKRTRKQVDELANQVAHWAVKEKCQFGDTCALMLLNCLDYPSIWLGIAKAGAGTALLNTNLFGQPFVHSVLTALKDSQSKLLIVDWTLKPKLEADLEKLRAEGIRVCFWGTDAACVTAEVLAQSKERPDRNLRSQVRENTPLVYIFTSGTTGLPKACKISQSRYFLGASFLPITCALDSSDVLYSPLPLYHSAAGMLGLGGAITAEMTFVTRSKFSASNFTAECLRHGVTAVQYIGEVCRYLVAAPAKPEDASLRLKVAFGNGMRLEYWTAFQQRYGVHEVVEFYGATEGNVALVNAFEKVGALGFIPRFADFIYPVVLVRVEPDDPSVPLRDRAGRCVRCAVDEPGLMLSELTAQRQFDGYSDARATDAKILRDVFCAGDRYFNTGDLVSRDAEGFFYWSDRVGDTFRWKGENVSTTEVSEVLSACAAVEDCVVYGVAVPHCDGKAGMAAVVPRAEEVTEEDTAALLAQLAAAMQQALPVYARVLFLRLKRPGEKLPVTTTFKYIKTDLAREAFQPQLSDRVFFWDAKTAAFQAMTAQTFADVQSGQLRF